MITHVGQFAEERFFTGAECAFDELDNTHFHAMAERPGHHAKTGTALAFARAGQHQQHTLFFLGTGDALLHDLLLCVHAAGMAFGVFGAFTHSQAPYR